MRCSYLIKHQKAHIERDIKVPNMRKASIRPCSQSQLLKKAGFGSSSVLIQLANVQCSPFLTVKEMRCPSLHFPYQQKHISPSSVPVVRNSWGWQLPDGALESEINSLL